MSWQPKTQENLIKQLIREQTKLRDVVYRTQFGHFAGGGVGGLGGFGSGGALGSQTINHYHPISTAVSNIKGDDSVDSTDGYSHIRANNTIIICEEAGSGNTPSATDPQVKWIDQTLFDGTLLILTPKEGKTLTLLSGGNINISSNTTVSSDEIIYLIYLDEHPSSGSGTGGSYNLLKMTTGGGGGSTSFVGFTADDDLNMSTRDIYGVDRLKFGTATNSQDDLADTDYGIEAYDGGSTTHLGLSYQVPSQKVHRWKIAGTEMMTLDAIGNGLSLHGNNLTRVEDILFDTNGNNDGSIQGTSVGLAYISDNDSSGTAHSFYTGGVSSSYLRLQVTDNAMHVKANLQMEDQHDISMVGSGCNIYMNGNNLYLDDDDDAYISSGGADDRIYATMPAGGRFSVGIGGAEYFYVESSTVSMQNLNVTINNANVAGNFTVGYDENNLIYLNGKVIQIGMHDCNTTQGGIGAYESGHTIGFHCTNNFGSGTKGQMESPYAYGSTYPTFSELDTMFGNEKGSIGVFRNSASGQVERFYFKSLSVWNYVNADGTTT